jgi:hypothetical protein
MEKQDLTSRPNLNAPTGQQHLRIDFVSTHRPAALIVVRSRATMSDTVPDTKRECWKVCEARSAAVKGTGVIARGLTMSDVLNSGIERHCAA